MRTAFGSAPLFLTRFTAALLLLSLLLVPGSPLTARAEAAIPVSEQNIVTLSASSLSDIRAEDLAPTLRQAMKERRGEAAVRFHFDLRFTGRSEADAWKAAADAWYEANWNSAVRTAVEHTGVPAEGDYIFYNLKNYTSGYALRADENGTDFTVFYTFVFLSDAEAEAAVTAKLGKVMASLGLNGRTDAEKIRTIYRWITENVTFDDSEDTVPYTAYGALINGRAVCQGIAALFYRMALEAGVDARIISGTARNGQTGDGAHAWNIVRIGDLYYYLDCTWDAGRSDWQWFLRGTGDFEKSHIPEKTDRLDYASPVFRQAYPVSSRDYDGPFGAQSDPPAAADPPSSSADPSGSGESSGSDDASGSAQRSEDEPSAWNNPFTDVSPEDAYYDAVRFVYENGLFYGVSDHEFAPAMTMTRAMFVTVLGRMAGIEADYSRPPSFADTEAGLWYSPYVDWAAEKGYVVGYGDGRFGPNDPVTREQAAVIMARMAASEGIAVKSALSLDSYGRDDPVSAWAREAVAWGLDTGIYPTDSSRLLPHRPAPRSFVARMLARYAEIREG